MRPARLLDRRLAQPLAPTRQLARRPVLRRKPATMPRDRKLVKAPHDQTIKAQAPPGRITLLGMQMPGRTRRALATLGPTTRVGRATRPTGIQIGAAPPGTCTANRLPTTGTPTDNTVF